MTPDQCKVGLDVYWLHNDGNSTISMHGRLVSWGQYTAAVWVDYPGSVYFVPMAELSNVRK